MSIVDILIFIYSLLKIMHVLENGRLSNFSAQSFINIYKGFAETIDLPLPTNCKRIFTPPEDSFVL
jgi:hypothetical protein